MEPAIFECLDIPRVKVQGHWTFVLIILTQILYYWAYAIHNYAWKSRFLTWHTKFKIVAGYQCVWAQIWECWVLLAFCFSQHYHSPSHQAHHYYWDILFEKNGIIDFLLGSAPFLHYYILHILLPEVPAGFQELPLGGDFLSCKNLWTWSLAEKFKGQIYTWFDITVCSSWKIRHDLWETWEHRQERYVKLSCSLRSSQLYPCVKSSVDDLCMHYLLLCQSGGLNPRLKPGSHGKSEVKSHGARNVMGRSLDFWSTQSYQGCSCELNILGPRGSLLR